MIDPMKIPPCCPKHEQALLGAVLDDNRHYNKLALLSADDFADNVHALIYAAIAENLDAGRAAYRPTLERELDGLLDEVGGVSYLEQLSGKGCEVIASARMILKMATLRDDKDEG
jgi:replicative DNA helicase